MKAFTSFMRENRAIVMAAMMIAMFATMAVGGASAQSLDTSAFTTAITNGMQLFFDNLPSFVLVGFAVFGVIFAFIAGLRFARYLLSELLTGLGGGGR